MSKIENSVICITGAAGFIGSNLCKKLLELNNEIIAIDNFSFGSRSKLDLKNKNLKIKESDIRNRDQILDSVKNSKYVFHLAGIDERRIVQKDVSTAFDVNVNGSKNVFSSCGEKQKIVYISSNMVYGEAEYLPIDEKHSTNCKEPYAITKYINEYTLKCFSFSNGYKYNIIRNFNTYGPGQNPTALIPTLILEGYKNKKIEVWSSDTVRDLQFIDDCTNGIIEVAGSDQLSNEIVNLASGKHKTIGEITDVICKHLEAERIDLAKPSPITKKTVGNINKITSLTNWKPLTSFEEGIKKTIEFYCK